MILCLDQFFNYFKELIILAGIILIVIACIKVKGGLKFLFYLGCIVSICAGTYFGIRLFKEVTAESYINGSITLENQNSQTYFNYSQSSLRFYLTDEETEEYSYTIELTPVTEFNGVENEYIVKINDHYIFDTEVTAGEVNSCLTMQFLNPQSEILTEADMHIKITMLADKSVLTIWTYGSEQAEFLQSHYTNYGITIKVIQQGGES